jgi:hypothetical protein
VEVEADLPTVQEVVAGVVQFLQQQHHYLLGRIQLLLVMAAPVLQVDRACQVAIVFSMA